jgi:putative transposase
VARAAQGPAAEEHGARLSHAPGLGRHAEAPAPRLVRPGPRAGRQGGEPDRRDHRQPEREGGGKRGARVDPSGYDAGKKVKGKKRHILVDTLGLLPSAAVLPADVQDRDGAIPLLRAARRLFPFVEVIFADGAYRGEATAAAVAGTGRWRLEIVSRGGAEGFVPLAKRWIVERTFAWLGRCRRLAKDFENLAVNALAFLCLGMIRLMLRRLARASAT